MNSKLNQLTQNALDITRHVTTKWSDRLAGSEQCLESANFLEKEFKKFSDETIVQDYNIRPGGFLGYIKINVILYLISVILLWFDIYLFAFIFSGLGLLILVMEFIFYKEFVDFLFPKKQMKNVLGVINPKGEIKKQIIISGHHDSAHVFNFLTKYSQFYLPRILICTLSVMILPFFCGILYFFEIFGTLSSSFANITTWVFSFLSLFAGQFWFFISKQGTPGAGDNMASTAAAMQIGEYFSKANGSEDELKNTRVIVASWDAEEAGLRGARYFVKNNLFDLDKIETVNLNFECFYNHNQMALFTSDINSTVKMSEELAQECAEIAAELNYDMNPIKMPPLFGGTDAAEFAKAGIEATTLIALDLNRKGNSSAYHTPNDTTDMVDPEAVKRSIHLGIEYVKKMDE